MDPCVLCFDDMDMKGFKDQRENTLTCVKLDCGHAYHTKCILRCLSQSNHKCPSCNLGKDAHSELTRDGLARELLSEIKKDKTVKSALQECNKTRKELKELNSQMTKEVKAFIKQRATELGIAEKRKQFMNALSKLRTTAKAYARKKGPHYLGALMPAIGTRAYSWFGSETDIIFFGRTKTRSDYRLKFPFFRGRLY
jgi:hypothetical protein